jgi:hypothetical protein
MGKKRQLICLAAAVAAAAILLTGSEASLSVALFEPSTPQRRSATFSFALTCF